MSSSLTTSRKFLAILDDEDDLKLVANEKKYRYF